uniref:Uncharacterized protein n=1 Tax=Arundo donax TaxID=35708 RepID=A0A0A9B7U8_ARUDO
MQIICLSRTGRYLSEIMSYIVYSLPLSNHQFTLWNFQIVTFALVLTIVN